MRIIYAYSDILPHDIHNIPQHPGNQRGSRSLYLRYNLDQQDNRQITSDMIPLNLTVTNVNSLLPLCEIFQYFFICLLKAKVYLCTMKIRSEKFNVSFANMSVRGRLALDPLMVCHGSADFPWIFHRFPMDSTDS